MSFWADFACISLSPFVAPGDEENVARKWRRKRKMSTENSSDGPTQEITVRGRDDARDSAIARKIAQGYKGKG